jgi:tetratricopeptide (TPR) repeat protein
MGFARHTLKKADLFFNHYEVPATNSFYFFRDEVAPVLGLPAPTWGALLPLALCGMFFARRNPRAQLLLLFFFTYALTVILTFNMSRYRMPAVPVMIVFAAGGAVALAERVRQRRIAAVAAAAAFLALAYPAVERDVTHDNYAANHLNLGVQHADQARRLRAQALQDERDGDAPAARRARDRAAEQEGLAEAQFRAGLEIQPGHPGLRDVLGKLLLGRVRERERAGRYEDALALATDLTATLPGFADGHVALGRAYFGLGRFGEARAALRRALELSPNHPEASAELALVIEFERAGGSR